MYYFYIMYIRLFNYVKNKLPRISSTELIALRSGDTSIDRDILTGTVNYPNSKNNKQHFEYKFDKTKLNEVLNKYDGSPIYPNYDGNKWINYLAKNKFFSFLIDEKYGGTKLSVREQSSILTQISSVSPALGVVVMVPNSLGPGELITKYGTESQKKYYLPKLANGIMIPCFGLTGPNNGSDATGSIDKGIIINDNGTLKLKINLNKRYITLAPVSNLMGIAFNLEDPNGLLNDSKADAGVTVALVERNHPNLIQDTHHNPMNVGFPNGTIKGEIIIDLDQVIGGRDNIGNGWKMLMECLSAGRGVSLPATANASSKTSTFGIYNYIQVREQFKMPLSNMEAIQEKFVNMVVNTWIIQSSIELTNDILDEGTSPAVISAIMKQQCTERGRMVLNDAMDIHGGAGICLGESNFIEKFYRGVPIGITVEGSNTLTRSLIIFGQGLNKSHPYIFPILESVLNNNIDTFKHNINQMILSSIRLYFKSLIGPNITFEQQLINFAILTNVVALQGGKLKKSQMLSGDMADIFSNLYLMSAVRYYHKQYNASENLTKFIEYKLALDNQVKINKVVNNLGYERFLLKHITEYGVNEKYSNVHKIFDEIMNNKEIIGEIKKNIHIENNILEDLENAVNMHDKNGSEYINLKNKIINVGEFSN